MPAHGILFNHESPRRAKTFVTAKISRVPWRGSLPGLVSMPVHGNLVLAARLGQRPAINVVDCSWAACCSRTPGGLS